MFSVYSLSSYVIDVVGGKTLGILKTCHIIIIGRKKAMRDRERDHSRTAYVAFMYAQGQGHVFLTYFHIFVRMHQNEKHDNFISIYIWFLCRWYVVYIYIYIYLVESY